MDSRKIKKLVLNNLAYVIFGYAGNIISFSFRTAEGKDVSEKILPALNNLGTAFAHIIPSFHPVDLLVGVASWCCDEIHHENACSQQKRSSGKAQSEIVNNT